jgi:hypothetical protein
MPIELSRNRHMARKNVANRPEARQVWHFVDVRGKQRGTTLWVGADNNPR